MRAADHIDALEKLIVDNPIIQSSEIKERRVRRFDAYLKVRLTLLDNSILEVTEYIHAEEENLAEVKRYTYHWMSASGQLLLRWDNVRHYPALAGFPHHLHDHDEKQVVSSEPMTLFKVLYWIDEAISSTRDRPHS